MPPWSSPKGKRWGCPSLSPPRGTQEAPWFSPAHSPLTPLAQTPGRLGKHRSKVAEGKARKPLERRVGFTPVPARERREGCTGVSPRAGTLHPQPPLPTPLHNVHRSPCTGVRPRVPSRCAGAASGRTSWALLRSS